IPIIAPTIPPSLDYTPASLDYSPASDLESDPSKDPSSDHIPPLPATSPFLSSNDDTTDSDSPDTPPSPTHDHSSPDLPSTSTGPSRKRRRSPVTSVTALPLVSRALSLVHANLIPSPKRVRDFGYSADVEVDLRETSLRDDIIARGNEEPYLEQDIDPEIQESKTGARVLVEVRVEKVTHPMMPEDIPEPAQEGVVEVTYETLEDLVQRIVGVESAVFALTERIGELERDNKRLRGTASVESQRVNRLQRGMLRMQR
ncbi:hypothetical protein Tco_1330558, partial [Tanacetum coccineum]